MQFIAQEDFDAALALQRMFSGQAKQNKVVYVAAITFHLQLALDETIQWVQVNQRVQLAQQIANGNTDGFTVIGEDHQQVHESTVLDLALDLLPQNVAINAVEEFADIQFQRIGIGPRGSERPLRIIRRFMGAIADPAGERLLDQSAVEDRVNHPVNRVLDHQISKGWGKYLPLFWLVHHEGVVRLGLITTIMQGRV